MLVLKLLNKFFKLTHPSLSLYKLLHSSLSVFLTLSQLICELINFRLFVEELFLQLFHFGLQTCAVIKPIAAFKLIFQRLVFVSQQ